MFARVVEKVGEVVDRRRFLRGTSAAAAAFVASLWGFTRQARAACAPGLVPVACCCLCQQSTDGCASNCGPCKWSWPCCDGPTKYRCWECHSSGPDCGKACVNIACSEAIEVAPIGCGV
jgi:hypothetical protein